MDHVQEKKIWTAEEIKNLLENNDEFLGRALKKLYSCQTADEKRGQHTEETNGVGFNKYDAEIMSSICEFLIRSGFMTDKQKALVRKKIMKYTKQLVMLANQ